MDQLPAAIRRALWESVVDWDPVGAVHLYADAVSSLPARSAAEAVIMHIRRADAAERRRFADAFEAKHNVPYPARAARSTVQRYERRA